MRCRAVSAFRSQKRSHDPGIDFLHRDGLKCRRTRVWGKRDRSRYQERSHGLDWIELTGWAGEAWFELELGARPPVTANHCIA